METQKEELTKKVRRKIIELFGPESALAEAMEDPEFMDKLGDLVSYIFGEIMLSQPRPQPPIFHKHYEPLKSIAKWTWTDDYTGGVSTGLAPIKDFTYKWKAVMGSGSDNYKSSSC